MRWALRANLTALIAQWRERATKARDYDRYARETFLQCADELEALSRHTADVKMPCPHCGLFGNHLDSCEYSGENTVSIVDQVALEGEEQAVNDAEFIAHARADIPYLLAALARLQAARDEAATEANDWRTVYDELVVLLGLDPDEGDRNEAVIRLAALTQLPARLHAAEAARDEAQRARCTCTCHTHDDLCDQCCDGGLRTTGATTP